MVFKEVVQIAKRLDKVLQTLHLWPCSLSYKNISNKTLTYPGEPVNARYEY